MEEKTQKPSLNKGGSRFIGIIIAAIGIVICTAALFANEGGAFIAGTVAKTEVVALPPRQETRVDPNLIRSSDLTILPGEWTPWLSTTSPNWNIRSPEMACAAVELKAAESHFFVYCPEGKTPPLDLYPGVKTVRAIPNVHAFSQRYRSLEDTEFVITVTDW